MTKNMQFQVKNDQKRFKNQINCCLSSKKEQFVVMVVVVWTTRKQQHNEEQEGFIVDHQL
jgi:hypothetical protein